MFIQSTPYFPWPGPWYKVVALKCGYIFLWDTLILNNLSVIDF